jgi:hypothetical protein
MHKSQLIFEVNFYDLKFHFFLKRLLMFGGCVNVLHCNVTFTYLLMICFGTTQPSSIFKNSV